MAAAEPSKDYLTQKDNTDLKNLPGKFGLPFIGQTFSFVTKPYEMLDELYKKHGPVLKPH